LVKLAPDSQNRRPDEEGIKTVFRMIETLPLSQNRRPDEEGIKTPLSGGGYILTMSEP